MNWTGKANVIYDEIPLAADNTVPTTKPPSQWKQYALLFALLIASYAPILARLVQQWIHDLDMNYGFVVPILFGLMVWSKRKQLSAIRPQTNLWGLAVVILAGVGACIGPPGLATFAFVTRIAFLMSIFGALLFLRGAATVRSLAYPLAILVFMVPPPGLITEKLIILPLRRAAAEIGEPTLGAVGVTALRENNVLYISNRDFPEPLSYTGLRMRSFSILALFTAVYAYFFERRAMMRALLMVSIVPVLVAASVLEMTATGFITGRLLTLVRENEHIAGIMILLVSLACPWVIHRLFRTFYPSEAQ